MCNNLAVSIFFGIFIGIISFFSSGSLFVALLVFILCYLIFRSRLQDKKFLLVIFILGVFLRIILSLAQDSIALISFSDSAMTVDINPEPIDEEYINVINEKMRVFLKMADSDYASIRGYMYAAHVKGINNKVVRHHIDTDYKYGWNGYLYAIGLFYYLFGYSPIAVKFVNCFIGALTALFVYLIGCNFNRRVARVASCMFMFFPSLVFWSAANMKDPTEVLLSVILAWSVINLIKLRKIRYLIIVLICVFSQYFILIRNIWLVSVTFILLTLIVYSIMKVKRKFILISLLLLMAITIPQNYKVRINSFIHGNIYKLCVIHCGHIGTPGVTYKIFEDKYYNNQSLFNEIGPITFTVSLMKGLFHFMFEPFPARISNHTFLLVLPQMILWYGLLFFTIVGIFKAKQSDCVAMLAVLIYLILLTLPIALSSGNVGTLFRHRDLVTPFYLIFAANGISGYLKSGTQEGNQYENILQAT